MQRLVSCLMGGEETATVATNNDVMPGGALSECAAAES